MIIAITVVLPAAGRHLVAQSLPRAAVAGNVNALLECARRLDPPDQRLDRFELAEIERMLSRAPRSCQCSSRLARDDGHAG